jgi:hypothetical protein
MESNSTNLLPVRKMNTTLTAILVFGCLAGAVLTGRYARRHLPDDHLSADSKDTVKLAMGLVATMTALLLGLLIGSAKASYDTSRSQVIQMAAKISFLDRVLSDLGPEGAPARAELRAAIEAGAMQLWPVIAGAPVQSVPNIHAGELLFSAIHALNPRDEAQGALKAQAAALVVDLAQLRALLLAQSLPSISIPLLVAVVVWLVLIFLGFSLLAPPNTTTAVALIASALCVSGAIFLILELDRPFSGLVQIPSAPLVHALKELPK